MSNIPREDHPLIEAMCERSAFDANTRDELTAQAALEMALLPSEQRLQVLNGLKQTINADDGVSLRQKSQLLGMRRFLRETHDKLRWIGR